MKSIDLFNFFYCNSNCNFYVTNRSIDHACVAGTRRDARERGFAIDCGPKKY